MPAKGSVSSSTKRTSHRKLAVLICLLLVVVLGAFLRFYQLGAEGYGNTYYAATVKSMLTSWHNFFFASFEPGGSVTVDKPPLGFWVQALSAFFLGVNGFALALPNALAGVFSIVIVFILVCKAFGEWPALVAALVLAVMPVAISTERNNTIDGLLVFVLLLAAWAVWRSVESGKFRFLVLSAFLVGLGFNIKMLQAYMVLPAFYLFYLLSARHRWWKRIVHLLLATLVLLAVSLAWVMAVDLTPADQRPFVGSSTDNTELELIVGHNGLSRLFANVAGRGGGNRNLPGGSADDHPVVGPSGQLPGTDAPYRQDLPNYGQMLSGANPLLGYGVGSAERPRYNQIYPDQNPLPPYNLPPNLNDNGPRAQQGQAGPNRSSEVGTAGLLRLFTEPLVTEGSWLLPLALVGIVLSLSAAGRKWPLDTRQSAVVMWAGWLLPVAFYFTFTTGLFHSYYLIMMGPGIAALVAAALWALAEYLQTRKWLGWTFVVLLTGLTAAFELGVIKHYPRYTAAVVIPTIVLWLAGVGLLAFRSSGWFRKLGLGLVLGALLAAPVIWSALTTFNPNTESMLPKSGPNQAGVSQPGGRQVDGEPLLDYLLANTDADTYLVATVNANQAAPYILATGRPVFTFGGFMGSDDIIDVEGLAQMIASDELRFILDNGSLTSSKPEIAVWVKLNCTVVDISFLNPRIAAQEMTLYDCGE
jgi:4-amino-4-deoxy-L-arabinose transferase-like glycosyltransferase